jgi:hypothetical protein
MDKIYIVKIYLNKELVYTEQHTDILSAEISANKWEDKGYICEIILYDAEKTIERGFWRVARIEE